MRDLDRRHCESPRLWPRHRLFMAALLTALSMGACLASQPGEAAEDQGRVVSAYTTAQARRGELIFSQGEGCVRCHSPTEFSGRVFEIRWADRTVQDLHHFILTRMPLDSPGSLTPDDAWALTAYMLQMNGYPAGDENLGADPSRAANIPLGAGNTP